MPLGLTAFGQALGQLAHFLASGVELRRYA
jgi:hypothetical protein